MASAAPTHAAPAPAGDERGGACQPQWSPTFGEAPGVNDAIEALAVFDGELYVGGEFTRAGSVSVSSLAKWDGTRWSDVAGGVDGTVRAMTVWDDGSGGGPALYVGGDFAIVGAGGGAVTTSAIAKWDGKTWSAVGGGINGFVWSLKAYDDGLGGGPALYVGGFFDTVGGLVGEPGSVPANRIAKWDGASWSALGSGMASGPGGQVRALEVFDDGLGGGPALYAGGSFLTADGITVNRIAKWNAATASWSAVGSGAGMNTHIWDLQVFNDGSGDALYAAGEFTSADGVPANRVARWNGTSWSAVGGGMTGTGTVSVRSLAVFDDGGGAALHSSGNFTSADANTANSFAKWDGVTQTWSAVGVGMFGTVAALAVYDDGLGAGEAIFAGGSYIGIGTGFIVDRILKWDGTNWFALGDSFTNAVRDLTVFDDGRGGGPAMYACGNFITANEAPLLRVAKWNGGTSWSPLSSGVTSGTEVYALAGFDDGSAPPIGGPALYAGGTFTVIGGNTISRVAKWDGAAWSALGAGTNNTVRALAVWDDGSGSGPALYVAGQFTMAGGAPASRIAKWDGTNWTPLGPGVNSTVTALAVFDDGTGGPPALYAAGSFTSAGGVTANRIAKWDGKNWSALGAADAEGVNALVSSLAVYDDGDGGPPALYVGGGFTMAGGPGGVSVSHIARWNGATWSDVGGGTNGTDIISLEVFDDGTGGGPALYAGGEFTVAGGKGGVPANRIAKWDGAVWSALGNGVDGPVGALAVFDDGAGDGPSLFVGGSFIAAPSGDSFIAKWSGCAATGIPGDANGDGVVDVDDLVAVILAWGTCADCGPTNCPADFDDNCAVDVDDLIIVILNWG